MLQRFLGILVIAVLAIPALATATPSEEWANVDALLLRLETSTRFTMEEDPVEFAHRWSVLEEDWKKHAEPFLARHGTAPEAIIASLADVERPDGARDARGIAYGLTNRTMPERRAQMAEWCDEIGQDQFLRIEQSKRGAPDRHDVRLRMATRAATVYRMAETFAPGEYAAELEQAEALMAETEEAALKAAEAMTWPGHNTRFSGPGDPDAMAAAALAFLRENPGWTKPEYDDTHIPVAAAVSGSAWVVEKSTPLTNIPTQYAVNMLVAFKGEKDPAVAYVYHMVFYTAERPGIQPGLPFHFANSRQYARYRMMLEKVPQ